MVIMGCLMSFSMKSTIGNRRDDFNFFLNVNKIDLSSLTLNKQYNFLVH